MPFDTELASVPASIAESFHERDPVRATASGSSGQTLPNAETLELFSQLLDAKFDQKFATFKRDLDEKEAATQSQLKKLKTEAKASSSFNFKGNKVQYEFNSSLLDVIDGVVNNISRGNLSPAISELERVKTLITKRNKLIRFADKSIRAPRVGQPFRNTSRMNSPTIQRTRKNSVQPREERSSRSGRRNVKMRLTALTLQLLTPNPAKVHLLVCPLAVRFLLISLFYACSPFVGVSPNRQISALAADRVATGRILPSVQAAFEDPSQPSQTVKMQADQSYQAVFQRLGQDEYDFTDLVKCLGDFDPVDLTLNFAESSDSLDSCLIASADYQDDTPIVKVKGNLKLNVAFWEHLGASRFIRDTIVDG